MADIEQSGPQEVEGREILIDARALRPVASRSLDSAREVFGAIAGIILVKSAHHGLVAEAAQEKGLLDESEAETFFGDFENNMRGVGEDGVDRLTNLFRGLWHTPSGSDEPRRILGSEEVAHATCSYDSWLDVATTPQVASLMFYDVRSPKELLKASQQEGLGYRTFVEKDAGIVSVDRDQPGLGETNSTGTISDDMLHAINTEIILSLADKALANLKRAIEKSTNPTRRGYEHPLLDPVYCLTVAAIGRSAGMQLRNSTVLMP